MKMRLVALIIALLGINQAHAGFMIEPYLGIEFGDTEYADGSPDDDFTGNYFGARVGYSMLGFMGGLDYQMGTGTNEEPDGDKIDSDGTDLGVFVGFEFPILVRAYISYFLKSEAEVDGLSGKVEGSGTRIGVGFTGLPFVAINVEMITRTYDEHSSLGSISEIETKTYAINVSLPLP